MSGEKAELRARLRALTASLEDRYILESDRAILQNILALPEYDAGGPVFTYRSVGRECDTRAFIEAALGAGRTVALPVSHRGGAMDFVSFTGALRPGLLGIDEPDGGEIIFPGIGDLMLVPALGCDRRGFRLGHGGGYYDRYLEKHPCFTVCLCREKLICEKIPREWNDLPVQAVITEKQVIRLQ